jgi:hypothetical protein
MWLQRPRLTVLRFAIGATTLITLMHVRLTAFTALTGLWAACSSALAPGTAMDGAADVGADAAGADVDSMADAALTQGVELMAAEVTLAAEHMLAGQVMAERLADTLAELAERPR